MSHQHGRVGRSDVDDDDILFLLLGLEHPNSGLEGSRSSIPGALCDAVEGGYGDGVPDEAAKTRDVRGDRGGRTRVSLGDSHAYLPHIRVEEGSGEGIADGVEATNA